MNFDGNLLDKLNEIIPRPSKRRRINEPPNLSFLTIDNEGINCYILFLDEISQETEIQKLLNRTGIIIVSFTRDLHTYFFRE